MKKALSLVVTIMLLATASFTLAQEKADPEKDAWKKVDQMDATQLREFLKKFPEGNYAKDAQFALSLHERIAEETLQKAVSAGDESADEITVTYPDGSKNTVPNPNK